MSTALDLSKRMVGQLGDRVVQMDPGLSTFQGSNGPILVRTRDEMIADIVVDQAYAVTPNGFAPKSLATGGGANVTFWMTPDVISGVAEAGYLDYLVTETGGTNTVTLAPVAYLQDHLEIGIQGRATPAAQILTADHLYAKMALYTTEQLTLMNFGNQLNISLSDFKTEVAVTAGGQAFYSQRLDMLCIMDNIDFGTISAAIALNWVPPGSAPIVSGTGVPQLTSLNLRLITRYRPVVGPKAVALYRQVESDHPYLSVANQSFQVNLAAGTASRIALQGADSCVALMRIMVRSSKAITANAMITFADLAGTNAWNGSIDIQDSKNVSLLGGGSLAPINYRSQLMAENGFRGTMTTVQPIYWITFAEDLARTIKTGKVTGLIAFDTTQVLVINPGTGFSSGSYTVDVDMYVYRNIKQNVKGDLSQAS